MRRRRRWLAAMALAVLVAGLWWWHRAPTPSRPLAASAPPVATPPEPRAEAPSSSPLTPRRPPAEEGPPAEPPVIDAIDVEKAAICEGEQTLVTVSAHTPGHRDDAYLHYAIAGEPGRAVAIRGRRDDPAEGEPPPRLVRVFGRNNAVTEAPLPEIRVEDCRVARRVHVIARLLPNREHDFELHAQIVDVTAKRRMRPVRALWSFGDGTTAESASPVIEHSYADRRQDALYSQFLIQVEVIGDDGERAVGRTSLQLLNAAFEHLAYRGVVRLSTALTPRFPVLDAAGVVSQRVRVWHHHGAPVALTAVLRRVQLRDGSARDAERLDPAALLGTSTLTGAGVEVALRLDTRAEPEATAVEYVLEGFSADGWPATGAFTLMRPPDAPTRENSQPVTDPLLRARIVRARERLGKAFVTDEDLWRLEKEGAFDDLPPRTGP